MTSHIPGYGPPPRRRGGVASIREDIHVHANAADVRALLADPTAYGAWLPPACSALHADTEGLAFVLGLPARSEAVSLRRQNTCDAREVAYRIDEGGAVDALTWALHAEGARECHVTLEVAYRPARGFLGGAAETLLHRPQRTQFVRDLLWNLKRDIEGAIERAAAADVAHDRPGRSA